MEHARVLASSTTHNTGQLLCVRLYVAGSAHNSVAALANLRAALTQCPRAELEVIDVTGDPARALRDGVTMTPMLVKLAPTPERRVLGALCDREGLLEALGLVELEHHPKNNRVRAK